MRTIEGIICLSISMHAYASEPPKKPLTVNVNAQSCSQESRYLLSPTDAPWFLLTNGGFIKIAHFANTQDAQKYIANRPLLYSKKLLINEKQNNEK